MNNVFLAQHHQNLAEDQTDSIHGCRGRREEARGIAGRRAHRKNEVIIRGARQK